MYSYLLCILLYVLPILFVISLFFLPFVILSSFKSQFFFLSLSPKVSLPSFSLLLFFLSTTKSLTLVFLIYYISISSFFFSSILVSLSLHALGFLLFSFSSLFCHSYTLSSILSFSLLILPSFFSLTKLHSLFLIILFSFFFLSIKIFHLVFLLVELFPTFPFISLAIFVASVKDIINVIKQVIFIHQKFSSVITVALLGCSPVRNAGTSGNKRRRVMNERTRESVGKREGVYEESK